MTPRGTLKPADVRKLVQAGLIDPVKGAKRSPPPAVITSAPLAWSVTLTIPCRALSEARRRDHWRKVRGRSGRGTLQKNALRLALYNCPLRVPSPPLTVTWIHVGPRMDEGDNLPRAFKAMRDGLAAWLGVDDGNECVEWRYSQRLGAPGVEVCIASRGAG